VGGYGKVLKHDPTTKDIPIIALTAHALASDREKAMEVACDGYLAKPCEPRAVVRKYSDSSGRRMGHRYEPEKLEIAARILIVDDHEDNVELLRARLESWGYETSSAKDGAEGAAHDRDDASRSRAARHHDAEDRRDRGRPPSQEQSGSPVHPDHHATALDSTEKRSRDSRPAPTTTSRRPIDFPELKAGCARCCASSGCRRRSRSASAS